MKTRTFGPTIAMVWLPIAAVATITIFFAYAVGQQVYRMSANDPQIQLSEDGATAIANGADALSVVPTNAVSLTKSLSPFVVVYNAGGQPIAANGYLNGAMPTPPAGTLTYAASHGQDRFTWQPRSGNGLRIAAVVTAVNGGKSGYVLAGRSLAEVESRIANLTTMMLGAWAAAMLSSFVLVAAFAYVRRAADRH